MEDAACEHGTLTRRGGTRVHVKLSTIGTTYSTVVAFRDPVDLGSDRNLGEV